MVVVVGGAVNEREYVCADWYVTLFWQFHRQGSSHVLLLSCLSFCYSITTLEAVHELDVILVYHCSQ